MKSSELLRRVQKAGWYQLRQEGTSHKIMAHDKFSYTISVPCHGSKEVGKGLAHKILKQAGVR